MDNFTLNLRLGNDAMQTPEDIAEALRRAAGWLEDYGHDNVGEGRFTNFNRSEWEPRWILGGVLMYRLAAFFTSQYQANRDTRTLLRIYGSAISPHLLDSTARRILLRDEN